LVQPALKRYEGVSGVRGWNLRREYWRVQHDAIGLVQFEYIKKVIGDAISEFFASSTRSAVDIAAICSCVVLRFAMTRSFEYPPDMFLEMRARFPCEGNCFLTKSAPTIWHFSPDIRCVNQTAERTKKRQRRSHRKRNRQGLWTHLHRLRR
jgi:hypothetical protein